MPRQSQFLPPARSGDLSEAVYSAESSLRHPFKLFTVMARDLVAARDLAWRLMVRDIRAQYRQSLLGVFWAFVPPIATAIGLTLANNAQVINVGATDIPYPAYVMLSMTLWQTFAESVSGQVQAIAQAKPLLSRINFPREALMLSQMGQVGFNFLIKLGLIGLLFLWFKIPVGWTAIAAPVALLHLVALGTGVGLLLAPIGGLYEDITKGLTLLLTAWLFVTPVLYPLPESGLFAALVQLNPVTPLLMTTRELATIGGVSEPGAFWIASLIALIVFLLGWLVYRVAMPFMIERISA
ncbi:ABC transporter permease [Leptolyngbya ohadii]|uniref:ABC transporter permease n=1 Tax=Leptolyngbya ohadii TaxID=1962290 RepID=UPI000B59F173|nr:ABC transporter permease [Leptolyngbya ohadii]